MLIENLLNRVDNLIIGGGMTYTFIKAMGGKIGKSLCEEDKLDLALKLIEKPKKRKLIFIFLLTVLMLINLIMMPIQRFLQSMQLKTDGWDLILLRKP